MKKARYRQKSVVFLLTAVGIAMFGESEGAFMVGIATACAFCVLIAMVYAIAGAE